MKKRAVYLIFMLVPIHSTIGQQAADVNFNHLSFTVGYEDLKALRESSYVTDTLGVFETLTTNIDSSSTITRCFIYGQSNYLELFETSDDDPNLGFLTIALGVDKVNGLQALKKELDKSYVTLIRPYERNFDDLKVPWYDALTVIDTSIVDSAFMTQAHFWFWIMGYKTAYFDYKGYTIENDELSRENYLEKYSTTRADRIIKNFTTIGIALNKDEKSYFTRLLENIGFRKINEDEYLSIENFRLLISERQSGDQFALQFIGFETSPKFMGDRDVRLSDHISVSIQGRKGYIFIE